MFSFRRIALALALSAAAAQFALAQDSSSSSSSSSNPAPQAQQQPANPNAGVLAVQARLRARREQRRAQAIHDVYSHLYELHTSMAYLRWTPGKTLQRVTLYGWDAGLTRYYNERLGVTLDGRGYYGSPFVGINQQEINNPAVSIYAFMGGPTYRFITEPKYAVSGQVMAGYAHGNFSGDTNGFGSQYFGLYPDGGTFIISVSAPVEYHVAPNMSLRLAPEYVATGFGSSMQNSLGFTGGFVFRFGKQ